MIERPVQDVSVRQIPEARPSTSRASTSRAPVTPDRAEGGAAPAATAAPDVADVGAAIEKHLDSYDATLDRIRPMLTPLEHAILDNPDKIDDALARANGVSKDTVIEKRQPFLRCGLVVRHASARADEKTRELIRNEFKARAWIEPKAVAKKLNANYQLVLSERRIMERTDQFKRALGLTGDLPATRQPPEPQPMPVWTFTRPDGTHVIVQPHERQQVLDNLHPGVTTDELLAPLEQRYGPIGYRVLNRWLGV